MARRVPVQLRERLLSLQANGIAAEWLLKTVKPERPVAIR
jgi:hypothetical protein